MNRRITLAASFILLFFFISGYSQLAPSSSFILSIRNISTSEKTLEFELYLLDTESATPFELALVQAGIFVNPELLNGGTVKASLVNGSSQLIKVQQPIEIEFIQASSCIKLQARFLKPLTKNSPPGPRGTIISTKGNGTRICRIQLNNSVAFAKVPHKLSFNFNKAPFPTSVFQYIERINTQLPCSNNNCIVKN